MKKHTSIYTLLGLVSLSPAITLGALDGVRELITTFGGLLKITIPIIFGLALAYFFWGIGQFILHAGDQKMREEGKQKMLWGVIALFVMVSISGILYWIGDAVDIRPGDNIDIPNINPFNPSANG